jgi:hypothetical protein
MYEIVLCSAGGKLCLTKPIQFPMQLALIAWPTQKTTYMFRTKSWQGLEYNVNDLAQYDRTNEFLH